MAQQTEFTGKKVLVTGGATGLGKAIVERFYNDGALVFVLDKNADTLAKLVAEFPNVITRQVDILDWNRTQEIILEISPLDHLVNNAGVLLPASLIDIPMENMTTTYAINVTAALNVTQAFVKGNADVGGTIVNISSVADTVALNGAVSYNCSKAAVAMLTKCMAVELGPKFRVNCIRPSAMVTNMMTNVATNYPHIYAKATDKLSGRRILPELVGIKDAANLVYFLSSSQSQKITGQGFGIDGGLSIN